MPLQAILSQMWNGKINTAAYSELTVHQLMDNVTTEGISDAACQQRCNENPTGS